MLKGRNNALKIMHNEHFSTLKQSIFEANVNIVSLYGESMVSDYKLPKHEAKVYIKCVKQ